MYIFLAFWLALLVSFCGSFSCFLFPSLNPFYYLLLNKTLKA